MIDIFVLGAPFLGWLIAFVGIHLAWFVFQWNQERKRRRRSQEYHRCMKSSFGDTDDHEDGGRP